MERIRLRHEAETILESAEEVFIRVGAGAALAGIANDITLVRREPLGGLALAVGNQQQVLSGWFAAAAAVEPCHSVRAGAAVGKLWAEEAQRSRRTQERLQGPAYEAHSSIGRYRHQLRRSVHGLRPGSTPYRSMPRTHKDRGHHDLGCRFTRERDRYGGIARTASGPTVRCASARSRRHATSSAPHVLCIFVAATALGLPGRGRSSSCLLCAWRATTRKLVSSSVMKLGSSDRLEYLYATAADAPTPASVAGPRRRGKPVFLGKAGEGLSFAPIRFVEV